MALNHVRKKIKPWCKISYQLFGEQYVYDELLEIFPFPKIIQLTYFVGGIQHCVTFVGDCIFDSHVSSTLPLTCGNLEYCFTNNDETKVMNGYKEFLNPLHFLNIERSLSCLEVKDRNIVWFYKDDIKGVK